MAIEINKRASVPYCGKRMRALVRKVLNDAAWEVSVAIVSPLEIKKINQQYRKKNKVTDVLSFLYEKKQGEIVICYAQVKKQAKANKIPIKKEFARMLIHGCLHLLGYRDTTASEAAKMAILEDKYINYAQL